ncbi:MAG: type II toxin-antitoxin system VapC family toxin [Thermoproteota archaeon]
MTYIDVNVIYYYLTAHEKYGKKSKAHIEVHGGKLVTSTLTVWLLHVLTRLENLAAIMRDVGINLSSLTSGILSDAEALDEPKDLEDRIHLSTMKYLGINRIISNDSDFDLPGVERIF